MAERYSENQSIAQTQNAVIEFELRFDADQCFLKGRRGCDGKISETSTALKTAPKCCVDVFRAIGFDGVAVHRDSKGNRGNAGRHSRYQNTNEQ